MSYALTIAWIQKVALVISAQLDTLDDSQGDGAVGRIFPVHWVSPRSW